MYKHILVAVDGSKTAQQALDEAIKLARQWQAQLRIVHVVDMVTLSWPESGYDATEVYESFRKEGRKVIEKAEETARAARVTAETKMLELDKLAHHVADLIAAEAEAWPADLIVIGSHGRRGVRRLLLGSVAEGVARIASKPVLLVRGG